MTRCCLYCMHKMLIVENKLPDVVDSDVTVVGVVDSVVTGKV